MKGILGLLRQKLPPEERKEAGESVFFSTAFADHGISAAEARGKAKSPDNFPG